MQSLASTARSAAGRSELPKQLLTPMQRQLELTTHAARKQQISNAIAELDKRIEPARRTRQRILEGAASLFNERGYHAVTVSELALVGARRVGIAADTDVDVRGHVNDVSGARHQRGESLGARNGFLRRDRLDAKSMQRWFAARLGLPATAGGFVTSGGAMAARNCRRDGGKARSISWCGAKPAS